MAGPARLPLTHAGGTSVITSIAEAFRTQCSTGEKASRCGRFWKYPGKIKVYSILFVFFVRPFISHIFPELRGRGPAYGA
jgi:hypothetical protein